MDKIVKTFLICVMLSISCITAVYNVETVNASGNILYVDAGGTSNYITIQSAIDDASYGDTIFVFSGEYNENVIVDKSVTIVGEDKNNTFVNSSGVNATFRIINNNVDMSGFSISNEFGGGGTSKCIDIHSNDNNIHSNILRSPFDIGITFSESDDNIIDSNIIDNSCYLGIGIFSNSRKNIIKNNKINNSGHQAVSMGSGSQNNEVSNNFITNSTWGVEIASDNNMVCYNTLIDNCFGIALNDADYNKVKENDISMVELYYGFGISFEGGSSYNDVYKNSIKDMRSIYFDFITAGFGICSSDNNSIFENEVICTNYSVYVYEPGYCTFSYDNLIYHNSFINNSDSAYDEYNNNWNEKYPSGGNYWSDYTGADSDGDGIGDTPYDIEGGSQDLYPLMYPWDQQKPGPKRTVFLMGRITNLDEYDDSYSFNVNSTLWVIFDPFEINLLNSNEEIVVDDGYMGILSEGYIFGFFNGKIKL